MDKYIRTKNKDENIESLHKKVYTILLIRTYYCYNSNLFYI